MPLLISYLQPSIVRLGILLLLFDVYLTWARIEKAASTSPLAASNEYAQPLTAAPNTPLAKQPLILQYIFFLALCTLCTLAFHMPIRLLTTLPGLKRTTPSSANAFGATGGPATAAPSTSIPGSANISRHASSTSLHSKHMSDAQQQDAPKLSSIRNILPQYSHPNRTSTALLLSSFTKLFPILMVIWAYDLPSSASAVSWAVIVNNIAALEILLDCGYARAALLAGIGAACRAAVGWCLLRMVGLEGGFGGLGVGGEFESKVLFGRWGVGV